MPRSLDDTYERMLLNIPDFYARDVPRIFQWMVYSARPLIVEELSEILAFDPDRNPSLDAQRRLFDPKQLLSILSNLATISTIHDWRVHEYVPKTVEVVTFSHYSVQEYLCSERIASSRVCQFSVTPKPAAHSIAKFCLTYVLQFDQADSLTPETYEVYPLARYAAQYWAKHAREIEQEEQSQRNLQPLIEQLFDDGKHAFLNWQRIYNPVCERSGDCTKLLPFLYTPVFCASALGLVRIAKGLLRNKLEINCLSHDKFSPLGIAAARGYLETVQLLIQNGADLELPSAVNGYSSWKRTPLCASALLGHKKVLKVLLDNGADVNTTDSHGATALYRASQAGHVEVVRTLIERGACLDVQEDEYGCTALMETSGPFGNVAVFELLLDAGANVNISDCHGGTALLGVVEASCRAEDAGFLRKIQALLDKKADPNVVCRGVSILVRAIKAGDWAATHLLLANGADPNLKDERGQTPLMFAASYNHESIVQLLVDNGAEANASSSARQTALSLAAAAGHENIVQQLLHQMNLTGPMAERWAASARLIQAIQKNKELEVAKLLGEGADPTLTDLKMRYSLHLAAFYGHESIVLMLLEHNLDIEARDQSTSTALDIAISRSHEKVVRCLLEKGARTAQESRRNPIFTACRTGNENIVRMLLDYSADSSSMFVSSIVLENAAKNGHHSVVRLLLERSGDLSRPVVPDGQSHSTAPFDDSLAYAAAEGHEETVTVLLCKGAEVDRVASWGGTALFWAAMGGHEGTVRLLLESGADPNMRMKGGATALYEAAARGHEGTVWLLLQASADPSAKLEGPGAPRRDRATALFAAAEGGHEGTVRLLLDAGADPIAKLDDESTPLSIAITKGHREMARIFREYMKRRDYWNLVPAYCSGA